MDAANNKRATQLMDLAPMEGLAHGASKLAECCTLLAIGYNLQRSGLLRPSDGQVWRLGAATSGASAGNSAHSRTEHTVHSSDTEQQQAGRGRQRPLPRLHASADCNSPGDHPYPPVRHRAGAQHVSAHSRHRAVAASAWRMARGSFKGGM